MSKLERTPESPNPKPFKIRGHHLGEYIGALRGGFTTAEQVEEILKKHKEEIQYGDYADNYRKDLLGEAPNGAAVFAKRFDAVMKDFLDLPDDASVEIGIGPDEICKRACAIGNHCTKANLVKFGGDHDTTIGDNDFVNMLLNEKTRRIRNTTTTPPEILERMKVSEEKVIFDDKGEKIGRKIETTAGDLKQILKDGPDDWDF